MNESARWIGSGEFEFHAVKRPTRRSSLKFLLRYPILLLAFGPPMFRGTVAGDTSQAHFDFWNALQVGWLFAIALRAIIRLVYAPSVLLPKRAQSILKYSLILGLLFMASIAYSPGPTISSEFLVLYFLDLVCVFEFLVDAYRNPPNWMECLFQLRLVAIVLLILVVLCLPIRPDFVMMMIEGVGIRLGGGSVGSMPVICPFIAIISAYSFLHSLEPRWKAALFFLAGLTGLLLTQGRGAEISLFLVLTVLGFGWAKTSRRHAQILVSAFLALMLLAGMVAVTIGVDRVWSRFNRGQDISEIMTASGRTIYWEDLILYSVDHPQGMGYIAGIRHAKLGRYAMIMHVALNGVGGTDNSYMQVLSDAGWLALALYLAMLAKIVAYGLRFAKKEDSSMNLASNSVTRHGLQCALFLLMYCLIEQMEGSDFVIPLRQAFYFQNITIAIILGASTTLLIASRPRYAFIK